jgi:hypothetical protein
VRFNGFLFGVSYAVVAVFTVILKLRRLRVVALRYS